MFPIEEREFVLGRGLQCNLIVIYKTNLFTWWRFLTGILSKNIFTHNVRLYYGKGANGAKPRSTLTPVMQSAVIIESPSVRAIKGDGKRLFH